MFNPMKAMKLLNERKEFANAHPDFYRYVKDVFGSEIPAGTEIEVCVKKTGKEAESVKMKVGKNDVKFFKMLEEVVK